MIRPRTPRQPGVTVGEGEQRHLADLPGLRADGVQDQQVVAEPRGLHVTVVAAELVDDGGVEIGHALILLRSTGSRRLFVPSGPTDDEMLAESAG